MMSCSPVCTRPSYYAGLIMDIPLTLFHITVCWAMMRPVQYIKDYRNAFNKPPYAAWYTAAGLIYIQVYVADLPLHSEGKSPHVGQLTN